MKPMTAGALRKFLDSLPAGTSIVLEGGGVLVEARDAEASREEAGLKDGPDRVDVVVLRGRVGYE